MGNRIFVASFGGDQKDDDDEEMKAAGRTNDMQVAEPGPFQEGQVMPGKIANDSEKSQSHKTDGGDGCADTTDDHATNKWTAATDDAAKLRETPATSATSAIPNSHQRVWR